MSRLFEIKNPIVLMFCLVVTQQAVAQEPKLDELAQSYTLRFLDNSARLDAVLELSNMLREEENGRAELARNIILRCWDSNDVRVKTAVLQLLCDPKCRVVNLKEKLLDVLSNERDLTLLNAVGETFLSQSLTEEEFRDVLRLSKQIGERDDDLHSHGGFSHSHAPQVVLSIIRFAASATGPGAYPILKEYRAQNPELFRRYGEQDWKLVLLDTNHPAPFLEEFERFLRGEQKGSNSEKASLIHTLTRNLAANLKDASRRVEMQGHADRFVAFLKETSDNGDNHKDIRIAAVSGLLRLGLDVPQYRADALACVKRNEPAWGQESVAGYIRSMIKKIEKANQSPK